MTKKKETNYFTLKTNGVELGTASHELQQNFLMTSSFPHLKLGQRHTLQITKRNERILIKVDKYKILDRNYDDLYNHPGQFGFYCEDAEVIIENFRILNLNMVRELVMKDSEYGFRSDSLASNPTPTHVLLSSSPSSQYQREVYPIEIPTEKHKLFDFDTKVKSGTELDKSQLQDEFVCDFEDQDQDKVQQIESNHNEWNAEYGD